MSRLTLLGLKMRVGMTVVAININFNNIDAQAAPLEVSAIRLISLMESRLIINKISASAYYRHRQPMRKLHNMPQRMFLH